MAAISDYLVDVVKNSGVAVDSQTAAIATATAAAVALRHNVVCKVDASYSSSTVSGLLTVTVGTTVATKYIHGSGALDFGVLGFQNPTANQAITASLANGGGGIVGTVVMTFYTTGPNF